MTVSTQLLMQYNKIHYRVGEDSDASESVQGGLILTVHYNTLKRLVEDGTSDTLSHLDNVNSHRLFRHRL